MRSRHVVIVLALAAAGAFYGNAADDGPGSSAPANPSGSSVSGSSLSGSEAPVNIVPRARPGEAPAAAPLPKANIRVDTNLVLIPVTVTDPLNRFVTGLDQDVFEVYEDKMRQKIVSFGSE